ncbi:MAG: coenzyme F420-0:L-glutamate ligase [Bacillales bacterium]|nr:coenzyme F420-0:L-glutamate ligase [Bacillales bacterium]
MRLTGVTSRGIRCPIIKEGDDLANIVTESVINASKEENFQLHDKDVIAITESIVARSEGNYVTVDDIAFDIKRKFKSDEIGLVFPILSRNRFSILLKGIARGVKKIYLMLSYPSDEVGNHLVSLDDIDSKGVNPYSDVLSLDKWRQLFGYPVHEFTGIDYISFYQKIINDEGCDVEFIFANNPRVILNYTKNVLAADIHTRFRTKRILKNNGGEIILGLDDICTESISGSGYNSKYGLLGSNLATGEKVKLFPESGDALVHKVQENIKKLTNKNVEVMVYGDGAFKDPQGKIWELADPVVSPFHTEGLKGTPNELKIKYLADNEFKDLKGEQLTEAIKNKIDHKASDLKGTNQTLGTTPRQITDLLGSLCDLTSGSGDKGTPVILVQGYFDNFSSK